MPPTPDPKRSASRPAATPPPGAVPAGAAAKKAAPTPLSEMASVSVMHLLRGLAPQGWAMYDPAAPDPRYLDHAGDRNWLGDKKGYHAGDWTHPGESRGDAYAEGQGLEVKATVCNYFRLFDDLLHVTERAEDRARGTRDPEVKALHAAFASALADVREAAAGDPKACAKRLFETLRAIDAVSVPDLPTALYRLEVRLAGAEAQLAIQLKATHSLTLEGLRQAIVAEYKRLNAFTVTNAIGLAMGIPGLGIGLLAGAELAIALGAGLFASALGFGVAFWLKARRRVKLKLLLGQLNGLDVRAHQAIVKAHATRCEGLRKQAEAASTLAVGRRLVTQIEEAERALAPDLDRLAGQARALRPLKDSLKPFAPASPAPGVPKA